MTTRTEFEMSMNIKVMINPHIIYYKDPKHIDCAIAFKKYLNIPYTNDLKDLKGERVLFLDFPSKKVDVEDSMYFKCQRLLDQTL